MFLSSNTTFSLRAHLLLIILYNVAIEIAQGRDYYYHNVDPRHAPCGFFETVNVTGDMRYENGSYLHNDILIPADLIGLYSIDYLNLTTFVTVEPHYRGCICNLRPCITHCCSKCEEQAKNFNWTEPEMNITFKDESTRSTILSKHFEVQYFHICKRMYALYPEEDSDDEYTIFENGDLFHNQGHTTVLKNHYCVRRRALNDTAEDKVMRVLRCFESSSYDIVKLVYSYAMAISMPFMVLTIIVYLYIKELRNVHGKSLVCYLIGLLVGYSSLCFLSFGSIYEFDKLISDLACKLIGYTAYFFLMSSFMWLSVIGFDLWYTFRGRNSWPWMEKNKFLIYSCYSWGIATLFLLFAFWAQTYSNFDKKYKPGIGGGEYCWVNLRDWSAMIYFYTPMILIIIANIVMFALTAIKIYKTQSETSRVMRNGESSTNKHPDKDQFALFLRLFIVMGITWVFEFLSYLISSNYAWIFWISDFFNAIQGFIIFLLFVMKKNVRKLIVQKLNRFVKRSPSVSTQSTTTSGSSANAQNTAKQSIEMKTKNKIEENITTK